MMRAPPGVWGAPASPPLAQALLGNLSIPMHVAVHVLGVTMALGIAAYGWGRRHDDLRTWRWFVAGGLLLAATHVLDGAFLFAESTWPLYLRTAGYAGLAVGAAGRLLGIAAVAVAPAQLVPVAPTVPSLAAGVAGAAAALAALRGVLRHGRGGGLLGAGLALWAGGDLFGAGLAADLLSLAGSGAVGAWLLARSRERLLSRVVASFLGALLVVVLVLAGLGGVLAGSRLQQDELARMRTAVGTRTDEIADEWTVESLTTAQLFASNSLARVIAEGDQEALERVAQDIAELPSVDVVVLADAAGTVIGSYAWAVEPTGPLPPREELLLVQSDVVQAAIAGAPTSGLVGVGDSDLIAVGASPVFPVQGGQTRRDEHVGSLVVGRRAADSAVVQDIADTTGTDVTVLVGGTPAVSTLPDAATDRVADLVNESEAGRLVDLGGRDVFLAASPFEAGPSPVGTLVLTEDATSIAAAERDFTRGLFLAALAGGVVAAVLAAWGARRTTRPLRELTAAADRVASGDRDVRTNIDLPDEVGRLARSFDEMTGSLGRREEELRNAAEVEAELRGRLEVLTASMGEGLLSVRPDGTVQTMNPSAEQLLGIRASEGVGEPLESILTGPNATALLSELGPPNDRDVRATRGLLGLGGRRVDVAATAAPLTGPDGSHHGRVYVLRDVTGEAEAERMKTQFLANVSHELRTPLTPIKGYAEVLRKKDVSSARAAEFASNIVLSTTRLERVIGMLVDFASLEAGRLDVRPEPTALDEVVDEVLRRWRERKPERRFTRRLARDLPRVQVDPELLTRVLEELMDNAVKFSDGPVRLRAARADRRVRLTVSDTGIGIPAEELHLITKDFHQIDGSATRRYGGLGLGLSLVQRIAERFDASVAIESQVEEGTDVHLLLPIADGTES